MASLEHGVPISPSTVFDVASLSKHFTAAAVSALAGEGALGLEDPVRRWIPELPGIYDPVTLRHLVHHTSGVRGYFALLALSGLDHEGPVDGNRVLAMLSRQRSLDFEPGAKHAYTNSNYALLGEVVRRAAGRPIEAYADERLFEPLAMRDTRFLPDHETVVPNRAQSYFEREDGTLGKRVLKHEVAGPSGLHTTVDDLARWVIALHRGEIGGGRLAADLYATGALGNGDPIPYGWGLRTFDWRGIRTVSHGGTIGGYRSYLLDVPEERYAVVVLCNRLEASPFRLTRQVTEIWLGDRLLPGATGSAPPEPPQPGPRQLTPQGLAGLYWSEELRAFHLVADDSEGATIRLGDAAPVPATVGSADRLEVGGATWTFHRGPDGIATGFLVDAGRASRIAFERVDGAGIRTLRVRYLQNSGWVVDTGRHLLVFDDVGGDPTARDSTPETGWIGLDDLAGRTSLVFATHSHADHWAPALATWPDSLSSLTLVLGWEPETPVSAVAMEPRERRAVGGATVTTISSTDLGVGFLVEVDGVSILHAGDHALWGPGSREAYLAEIEWLAAQNVRVDVAFLPIATGVPCDATPSIREGASLAIERLEPSVVFPMHVRCVDRLEAYAAFAEAMRARFPGLAVFAPSRPGETFELPARLLDRPEAS